jgi:hypothetical protein
VKVVGDGGSEVQGVSVAAFTWSHEDYTNRRQPSHLFSTPRFTLAEAFGRTALLENAVSAPSDSDGVATFENLRVSATDHTQVWLYVACQGHIVSLSLVNPPEPAGLPTPDKL